MLHRRALWAAVAVVLVAAATGAAYVYRHKIYAQLVMAKVANDGAPAAEDGEDLALGLFDHVVGLTVVEPSVVIDDYPAATLIRGHGYCDSVAMAFVRAAERRGLVQPAAWSLARIAARFGSGPLQDLYLMTPPPEYVDTRGEAWETWDDPAAHAYFVARNYQLFGRLDRARGAYQEVLEGASAKHAEAAGHFLSALDRDGE